MGELVGAGVDLEAGVAELHDVIGTGRANLVAGQVPVHDVPSARAQTELDGGGVEDDPVPDRDGSDRGDEA